MTITAEPTNKIELVDGKPTRVWNARIDGGRQFQLFVAMVQVPHDDAETNAALERVLQEVKAERQLAYFDHRLVAE